MDYIDKLGLSIENVAWRKSGIFKPRAPAFSAPQDPAVANVLRQRAKDAKVDLAFVGVDTALRGLDVEVLKLNCSLARRVCEAFLSKTSSRVLEQGDDDKGIEEYRCDGRFQVIHQRPVTWCLDGAHNELSIPVTAEWCQKLVEKKGGKLYALIFAHISDHRDGARWSSILPDFLASYRSRWSSLHTIMTGMVARLMDTLEQYVRLWGELVPQTRHV
ncbi:hypothetical protein EDB80DRAFT_882631 [Ilyonectria destructans]|nr:hypothetical protein EDB80DRAFT_882631 [Ilyonectria destructans]